MRDRDEEVACSGCGWIGFRSDLARHEDAGPLCPECRRVAECFIEPVLVRGGQGRTAADTEISAAAFLLSLVLAVLVFVVALTCLMGCAARPAGKVDERKFCERINTF